MPAFATFLFALLLSTTVFAPVFGQDEDAVARRQQQRVAIFNLTLMGDVDTVDATTRAAAAVELLAIQDDTAMDLMTQAMRTGRPEVVRAVVRSLDAVARTPERLVATALQVLPSTTPHTREPVAHLLARAAVHDPGIIVALHERAADPETPDERRVAAISALGEFRHTPVQAAAALMSVLEQPLQQSPDVLQASTASLSRLTGLPATDDVDVWTRWWSTNRDRPSERWLADMVQALSRRVTSLEQASTEATAGQSAIAQRMLAVHRDLWPLLGVEDQVERLGPLLEDDLVELRGFGLERAAVLLRDGNATEATHAAVIARLQDPDPTIRLACAAMLPELPGAHVAPAVGAALDTETDIQVARALLRHCAADATLAVPIGTMAVHLAHPELCGDAAGALWERTDGVLPDQDHSDMRDAIAAAQLAGASVNLNHLAAALGNTDAIEALTGELTAEDGAARARAAEALRRGGAADRVRPLAHDAAIFPVVIRIAASGEGLDAFDAVAALTPVAYHEPLWRTALLEVAAGVPINRRVHVDNVLAPVTHITPAQRIELLSPAVAETADDSVRLAAAERLAPLLKQVEEDTAIIALVASLPAEHTPESLQDAAFEAALRARLFNEAATMRGAPRMWVTAYERLAAARPELADLVRTEIVRRFNDNLDATMRTRMGMAEDPLMGDASDAPGR